MKVRDKDVGGKWLSAELTLQCMAKHTESRAAVEDVDLISDAHFHAGGIASVAQVLGLWSGRGAAHAPKLNSHKPRVMPVLDDLRRRQFSRQNTHNTRDITNSSHCGEGNK